MSKYPWLNDLYQIFDKLLKSNVLIIEGPKGLGKKAFAIELAKKKLCIHESSCDACSSCQTFDAGTHLDFFIIQNPEYKIIKVNNIRVVKNDRDPPKRNLSDFINLSSASNKKVAVIETGHLMNEQCQNAILKIAEEISLNTSLIILSDRISSLVPTIYSRAHKVVLNNPDRLEVDNWIKSLGYHDESAFNFPTYLSPLDILEIIKANESNSYKEMYVGFQNLISNGFGYDKYIKHFKDMSLSFQEKLFFLNDSLKIQLGKNLDFYPSTDNRLSDNKIMELSNLIEEISNQILDLSKVSGLNEQVGMNYFLSKVHSIYN
tara:strand:- start:230 stop:1186 length:957 start_codon:yes stop_codon:yes gene_type:complete